MQRAFQPTLLPPSGTSSARGNAFNLQNLATRGPLYSPQDLNARFQLLRCLNSVSNCFKESYRLSDAFVLRGTNNNWVVGCIKRKYELGSYAFTWLM